MPSVPAQLHLVPLPPAAVEGKGAEGEQVTVVTSDPLDWRLPHPILFAPLRCSAVIAAKPLCVMLCQRALGLRRARAELFSWSLLNSKDAAHVAIGLVVSSLQDFALRSGLEKSGPALVQARGEATSPGTGALVQWE